MTFDQFIHVLSGVLLMVFSLRELRRILSEPPERPIDVWTNRRKVRYRFRATPMQPRKYEVDE